MKPPHLRVELIQFPFLKKNFVFNNSLEKDKNGILMLSPIDFFGEMGIKVEEKIEIEVVFLLVLVVI